MDADWTSFWKRLPLRSLVFLKMYELFRFRAYSKLLSGVSFSNFADLGGGSGISAERLCRRFRVKGVIVDNNKEAYTLYSQIHKKPLTTYVKKNLFTYKITHDLIISDGLIEHFQPQERSGLVTHHKKLSKKYVLIFVPKQSWIVDFFLK